MLDPIGGQEHLSGPIDDCGQAQGGIAQGLCSLWSIRIKGVDACMQGVLHGPNRRPEHGRNDEEGFPEFDEAIAAIAAVEREGNEAQGTEHRSTNPSLLDLLFRQSSAALCRPPEDSASVPEPFKIQFRVHFIQFTVLQNMTFNQVSG